MEQILEQAMEYVKDLFKTDHSGHDYFHTLRVYKMATHIAEKEQADIQTVQLAALLHDVDDIKLSPNTNQNKENARRFLQAQGVSTGETDEICRIIHQVSYQGTASVAPDTLEGQCVQDADRLDAIGAIGIARAFAYGGNRNRVLHDPDIPPKLNMNAEEYHNHISTTINHFYEKLFNLRALMNTATAREIAQSRDTYMKEYIRRFMDEWEGIQ